MKSTREAPEVPAVRHLPAGAVGGTVVWTSVQTCRVLSEGAILEPYVMRHEVAVGDKVICTPERVLEVLPRLTRLSRPDVDNANKERVIAANLDVAVLVVSVKEPPLHPRLIDRVWIAVQHGGAAMWLCVNKEDLLDSEKARRKELGKLEPYEGLFPIHLCSVETGKGVEELREAVNGKTCAFIGHSGVGKSSVLNALFPELGRETGLVSQGYGRGTHTTTAGELFELGETRLIDTPGVRSFGLWDLEPDELAGYFPEFQSVPCRFRNCRHLKEPGCGVKAAVEAGTIHTARYDTYLRLLE